MEKIKVVILSNGELQVKEIDNTLEELQKIVGGYIEIPLISKVLKQHNIDTIINEEGKYIDGLQPQIAVIDSNNRILDVIYGSCIFASHDIEGNTISLNDEQIKVVMEELKAEVSLNYQDDRKKFIVKALFV